MAVNKRRREELHRGPFDLTSFEFVSLDREDQTKVNNKKEEEDSKRASSIIGLLQIYQNQSRLVNQSTF